jgi:hypothetical protein
VAVAFRSGSNSGNLVEVSSLNVPVPTGAAAGDIAVISLVQWNASTPTVTPPSGFVQKGATWTSSDGVAKNSIWWKRLTGADTGNYSFSWTGGVMWSGAICALFTGCATSGDPWDAVATPTTGTWGNPTSISVTTTDAAGGLFWAVYNDTSGTHTPPTGFTEIADIDSASCAYYISGVSGSQSASGATISSSSAAGQWLGALLSDGGGAPAPVDVPPFTAVAPGLFRGPRSRAQGWAGDTFIPTPTVAEQGTTAVGLATTGTAKKVQAHAGVAAAGVAGAGVTKKTSVQTGVAALGLAGTRSGVASTAETGRATAGLASTATTVKVAKVAGSGSLGAAATGTAGKSALTGGAATLGLASTGAAAVAVPAADSNQARPLFAPMFFNPVWASPQLAGSTQAAAPTPSSAETGTGLLGLAGAGTARKVTAQAGSCGLGLAAAGVAKRVAVARGAAALGLAGTRSGIAARAVTGVSPLGLVAAGAGTKRATSVGAGTAGLAATGAAKKTAAGLGAAAFGLAGTRSGVAARAQTGTSALGLAGTAAAKRVAVSRGTTTAGLAAAGAARKAAPARGLSTLALSGTRSQLTIRAATGTCTLGAHGRAPQQKTATVTGSSHLGAASTSSPRRRATGLTGATCLGLAQTGREARIVRQVGAVTFGTTGDAVITKRATTRGVTLLGVLPLRVEFAPVDLSYPIRAGVIVDQATRYGSGSPTDETGRSHAGVITDQATRYRAGAPT